MLFIMDFFLFLQILFVPEMLCSLNYVTANPFVNDRPIIGILSKETYKNENQSTLEASYVKLVESSGARVVPLLVHQSTKYYEELMKQINGIIFPGGAFLVQSTGYGRSAKIIFDIAVEMNKKGDYFPLWGICLGFETLSVLASEKLWLTACQAADLPSPVQFTINPEESRMFHDLKCNEQKTMERENVTINYHQWCLTPENFTVSGLNKFFKIISTSRDLNNLTYVSSMEAINFPFYGVAFHPEKVLFEWVLSSSHHNIPHTNHAIQLSQYLANFFISEAKKSHHSFVSLQDEREALIYNYNSVYTGKKNSSIEQKYYFNIN